jgi:uncharacterized protein (DUF1800 family)
MSGLPRVTLAQSTTSTSDAARFLEQATFGPTAADMAHVQDPAVGIAGWLTEQFGMPVPSEYLDMETCPTATGRCPDQPPTNCGGGTACNRTNYTMHDLQQRFFGRALNGADQLRQRVVFALNQIMVISAQDGTVNRLNRMEPYIQVLERDAFGNFRDLLYDITLNAGMGRYLDMVNNNKNAPNENYAREILQLFSIGLDKLNPDGTPMLDDQSNRLPTYTQDTVTNFARVFTGWTFQVQPNPPEAGYVNYIDPMRVGSENNHDRNPKTLLDHGDPSCSLPGGENAAPELSEALSCIMSSPYVAPYISKNLIQHLVTSNPSPTYVGDVSNAFVMGSFTDSMSGQTFGSGVTGDLQAVVAAILLDPEARGDAPATASFGHLREPVLFITNLLRAFNTSDSSTDYVLGEAYLPADIRMDEDLFRSPTVFNFFPPGYAIPGEQTCGAGGDQCLGPEFNIQSTATALARVNFAWEVVFHQMPFTPPTGDRPNGTWIDEGALMALPTDDPQALVDTLNGQMMHGAMTSAMNARIVSAVTAVTDPDPATQGLMRAREAVYLIATSSEYNVER